MALIDFQKTWMNTHKRRCISLLQKNGQADIFLIPREKIGKKPSVIKTIFTYGVKFQLHRQLRIFNQSCCFFNSYRILVSSPPLVHIQTTELSKFSFTTVWKICIQKNVTFTANNNSLDHQFKLLLPLSHKHRQSSIQQSV